MNKISLVGNLCNDPEMRTTQSGISVCSFRVAVNRRYKDADGNQKTDYIPVQCWRQLADLSGRYLSKGKKVGVVGALQSNSYEDKSGNRRTSYTVVADELEFLTPKGNEGSGENASQGEYEDVRSYGDMTDDGLPF